MVMRWGACLCGLLLWGVAAALAPSPAGAVVDDPDLDSRGDYTYNVDTDAGVVRVSVRLAVTADRPDEPVANGVYQYYYDGYAMLIPAAAENVTVIDASGTTLQTAREEVDEFTDLLTIDFRRSIFYRQTADLTVAYGLPAGDAGSDSIVRVNPAYVSFAAWTSPNLEEATVSVELPASFNDESNTAVPFVTERTDSGQMLVADEIDPESYYALVSLVNTEGLQVERLPLPPGLGASGDAQEIEVRYWPGDDAWRDHVAEGIEEGLPALGSLIGRPWPLTGDLQVTESFAPVLYGYAGWYDSESQAITITDLQDDHILYHELAHVWLNRELFADRWILEGLAELFAAETAASLGEARPEPATVSLDDDNAIALSHFDQPSTEAQEAWGYDASWHVMEQVEDEIGLDGLALVIEAAATRQLSYPGDTDDGNTMRSAPDWRQFLDLAENIQNVDEGPLTVMVEQWVLDSGNPRALAQLDARSEARPRYRALAEVGGEWAPPTGIRQDMTQWRFDDATEAMEAAEAALERRDELRTVVEPTSAPLPEALEMLYETTDDDYDALEASLERAEEAGAEIRQSHDATVRSRSILERVGLLGTDVQGEQAQAVDAFAEGQLSAAVTEADEVDRLIDDASRQGLLRIGLTLVGLLLVVGIIAGIRRALRRRRPGPRSPIVSLDDLPDPHPVPLEPRSH